MSGFWTRTRRYMAAVWLGTAAAEALVLWLAWRTNDSWFLLLAAAVLALPIIGWELTSRWLGRAPRKRWKRHDVEAAAAAAAAAPAPAPSGPPATEPPAFGA